MAEIVSSGRACLALFAAADALKRASNETDKVLKEYAKAAASAAS